MRDDAFDVSPTWTSFGCCISSNMTANDERSREKLAFEITPFAAVSCLAAPPALATEKSSVVVRTGAVKYSVDPSFDHVAAPG